MKQIYTDGSCLGNPGPGSWAAIVVEDDKIIEVIQSEVVKNTTNNRMEMSAILWAKECYGSAWINTPTIYTDSSYALNSFTTWIKSWKNNGWVRSNGAPLENLDLIKMYDKLESLGFQADIQKVKGHANDKWNNLADKLATRQITKEEVLKQYG